MITDVAAIKERILQAIGDNVSSPVIFTAAQLLDLVNEANEVLCEVSRVIKRSAVLPLRPGMRFIYTRSVAPDLMLPTRIWTQDRSRKLTCISMNELDEFQERWTTTTGPPEVWYPVGWDMIGIYPTPVTAGGVLIVDYISWPRALFDDDDEPEFSPANQDPLVLYGVMLGALKKWDTQAAITALNALLGQQDIARARLGIGKMSPKFFQRQQQPQTGFPTRLRDQEGAG